jgi:hypothetical protein
MSSVFIGFNLGDTIWISFHTLKCVWSTLNICIPYCVCCQEMVDSVGHYKGLIFFPEGGYMSYVVILRE